MPMKLQFKRNSTSQSLDNYIPSVGEPIYDTVRNQLYVGDGTTVGGKLVSDTTYTDTILTTNYTAKVNEVVYVNCSNNNIIITLPSNPINGSFVKIIDAIKSIDEDHVVTVNSSASHRIDNTSSQYTIDTNKIITTFIFSSANSNWIVESTNVEASSGSVTITDIDFGEY